MFELKFGRKASKFFYKLDKKAQESIGRKLEKLKLNPELGKPLTGKLSGLWSLRIEKYRLIYQVRKNELIIFVLNLGHRKNIYGK